LLKYPAGGLMAGLEAMDENFNKDAKGIRTLLTG
jgi:hypothetical protein